jgi:twinkle protein
MYPYFMEGQTEPVAFKVRDVKTKSFRVVGSLKGAGLFGQQKFGNYDRKRIIITEGELDAIAAMQMLNNNDAVVSLRGGAAAVARDLKDNYTFIDGFKEVVLCFDTDAAGQDAVAKACDIFAGKVRVMKLDPNLGKDACDYLIAGKADEFVNSYWTAPLHVPEGITDVDELWKELTSEKPRAIGDYPWEGIEQADVWLPTY